MRIFLFPALAILILVATGCESDEPSDWPPKFTRFSVALYNVRVLYDNGSNEYASAFTYKYNYYLPDSSWKYSLNGFATSCSTSVPVNDPMGSASLQMRLHLKPTGNGYYELTFSSHEASEGFAPSSHQGYSRRSSTDISFTLVPISIWDDDTLALVWRGDDLDRLLRNLWYTNSGSYTSNNYSSSHYHTASVLGPQPDSAAITVQLYK